MTLRTPGPLQADPVTGNEVPGPTVETVTPAYLAQRPVANLSSAIEDSAGRDTVTSLYTLLVPPGTPLTSRTQVVDVDGTAGPAGAVYEVEGDPAPRRGLGRAEVYIAAALRRTSDLQGV